MGTLAKKRINQGRLQQKMVVAATRIPTEYNRKLRDLAGELNVHTIGECHRYLLIEAIDRKHASVFGSRRLHDPL